MRRIVGKRLPKFTEGESKLVKWSFDFLAGNYCTTYYADAAPPTNAFQLSYTADRQVNLTSTYPACLRLPLLLLYVLYYVLPLYICSRSPSVSFFCERDGVLVGSLVFINIWHFFFYLFTRNNYQNQSTYILMNCSVVN